LVSNELLAKIERLPEEPGVYLMKDSRGRVIYVGKAASLRSRVRSYFRPSGQPAKVKVILRHLADVDYTLTDSEIEALILECNLIKKYRPRYNVRLRDDKNYPYLRIATHEDFPRVSIARSMGRDGARYFGPYTRSGAVSETLRVVRKVFPFRTCGEHKFQQARRPCLDFHVKRCLAPCTGEVDRREYREMIRRLCLFLEGRREEVAAELRRCMEEAAEKLEFEKAAEIRDQLRAVERVVAGEKQKIVSASAEDHDILGLARDGDQAAVWVFPLREGKLLEGEGYILEGTGGLEPAEVAAAFIKQHYSRVAALPRSILLPAPAEEAEVLQEWLGRLRGGRVELRSPRRGPKRSLVEMANKNALRFMEEYRAGERAGKAGEALQALQEVLGLERLPVRIECFDVSNLQAAGPVGSMVVFEEGRPAPADYRRFRIRGIPGPDDYAMLQEVLRRRYGRLARRGSHPGPASHPGPVAGGEDPSFSRFPDLILVDGGKGQVSASSQVLQELGLGNIPVAGLAKAREEVFLPDRPDPLALPRSSPALHLLQRIRDEAHRFALCYHRGLRRKESLRSLLEEVPGIGPRRRRALQRQYGSVDKLRQATVEELAALPGMNRTAAAALKDYLGDRRGGDGR